MTELKLPIRLEENIIVDAVFELRFNAELGFSNLVPGAALKLFGEVKKLEKSPIADLPLQVRNMNPNLQYQPTITMIWDDVVLMLGDNSLAIGYGTQYKGWKIFQKHINILMQLLTSSELSKMIKEVNRYSFRYVDFFPEHLTVGLNNPFLLDISIGNEKIQNTRFRLQYEEDEEFGVSSLEFSNPVNAEIGTRSVETGALISIDTVRLFSSGMNWDDFQTDFDGLIEKMHLKNKQSFFKMLSQDLLNKLGPIYE